MVQLFERGNLVEVSTENNELAVIEGSYGDLYGTKGSGGGYSIIFLEHGNSLAWVNESNMKLINKGGEHLFDEAKQNKERTIEKYTNIDFIRDSWDRENPMAASSITIRYLFKEVGYESLFERNGEFFVLYNDWVKLFPLFDCIITNSDFNKVEAILKEDLPLKIKNKIKKLHEIFHD